MKKAVVEAKEELKILFTLLRMFIVYSDTNGFWHNLNTWRRHYESFYSSFHR